VTCRKEAPMTDSTAVTLKPELVEELMKAVRNPDDLFGPEGLFHRLKAALMERMLEAELTEHLGFEKNAAQGRGVGNSRNGYTTKTVKTDTGPVEIRVPRDRLGTFEPKLVAKHQRRLPGFDEKVLALYARGMSVRDIQSHLEELYGTDVAPELISRVTDAVLDEMRVWQSRPLEAVYPIVYIDALFVSVRDGGVVTKKAVYVALGTTVDGERDVLGLWVDNSEGARFWLHVLTELKNRGVSDILFVCCDGLTGLPQSVEAVFPRAVVQTCIVHMIRASLRYVTYKDRQHVVSSLRGIYAADTEDAARAALDAFNARWGARHPNITKLWEARWNEVVPFLAYPAEIRRILYTTNAVESLNFQLRKVLRPKGHFPTEDAVLKILYLAIQRAKMKWKPAPEWRRARAHFAIVFGDRLPV
jgi:putative transposase